VRTVTQTSAAAAAADVSSVTPRRGDARFVPGGEKVILIVRIPYGRRLRHLGVVGGCGGDGGGFVGVPRA